MAFRVQCMLNKNPFGKLSFEWFDEFGVKTCNMWKFVLDPYPSLGFPDELDRDVIKGG